MQILLHSTIIVSTFFFMEFMAWFMHKYVMHGVGWYFHKDHHQKEPGFFEKNDVFFLIFAVPSWLFIMLGMMAGNWWLPDIGFGIAIYGFCYFLVHDVFIHQRFKWFQGANSPFWKAIRKAHNVHHKHKGKAEGECFGMLVVPWKYYKEAFLSARKKQTRTA